MEVNYISEQGTVSHKEDGMFLGTKLFVVFDGLSVPYSPSNPIQLFDGLSSGEMVVRRCEEFLRIHECDTRELWDLVLAMNEEVANVQRTAGIAMDDPVLRAGAVFALAKVSEQSVSIAQTGDCVAIVQLKSGKTFMTPNRVQKHDSFLRSEMARLSHQVAEEKLGVKYEEVPQEHLQAIRDRMIDLFYPILLEARRENMNRIDSPTGYGLMNGQAEFERFLYVEHFPRKEVLRIVLLTDGLIPWTEGKDASEEHIVAVVLGNLEKRNLQHLGEAIKSVWRNQANPKHVSIPEMTAVEIVLPPE